MADITPINYSTDVATPFASALQGYQAGAAIRDDQANQLALQAKQQAAQQQQLLLTNLANNPNASGADYAKVMTIMPGVAESLQKAWGALSGDQQQAHLTDLSQWGSAISSGQPQIAADAMTARANAMEKAAGPTPASQALRAQAQVTAAHPQFALGQIQAQLAAHPDGSKVATTLAAIGGEQRAEAQAPADLLKKQADATTAAAGATVATATVPDQIAKPGLENQNVTSQIQQRAAQLGLDRDKLVTDTQLKLKELGLQYGQLPPSVGEAVTTAATDAIAADQSASRMTDIANRIDQASLSSGGIAKGEELLKRISGNQNEVTRLRAEYNRIVTPAAMAAYKKVASGSTSDKDIDVAMTGVPPDTADPATMSAFLRGAAKLQVYDSVLNNAKSEWLGAVRNLGKTGQDIEIDGVQVPKGTTFKNFADDYVQRKVIEKTNANTIKASPYAQFAAPPQVVPAPGQ